MTITKKSAALLVGLGLITGGAITAGLQTKAQTTTTTDSTLRTQHIGSNGTKEELLTGDTAEKVKAAALAANSGGTIQRVETDAEGAAYEAHMTKSDGSMVTVKFDSNYNITGTETGHGNIH